MTPLRQRVLLTASAIIAFVPAVAFAQLSLIKGGVDSAAGSAGLRTAGCSGTECATRVIGQIITVALSFSGIVLLGLLIYAGFLWMTAQDAKDVGKAQEIIKNAVAGLVLIAASYAIASFVLTQLSTAVGTTTGAPAGATTETTTGGAGAETPTDGTTPRTPAPVAPDAGPSGAVCSCGCPLHTPASIPIGGTVAECNSRCASVCVAYCNSTFSSGITSVSGASCH